MKKYVKSSYTYDPWKNADLSKWSDADIDFWNRIQWADRDYRPVADYDDEITGYLTIYGIDDGPRQEQARFVKTFSANTIYPPSYEIHEDDWYDIKNKCRKLGYNIVGPMYDGTNHRTDGISYKVMDRADTQELYDRLSR